MRRRILVPVVLLFVLASNVNAQMPEVVLPVSHSAPIYSTQFIQNGKYLITLANDNSAKLWDVFSGRLLHTFKDLNHTPRHILDQGNTTLISKDENFLIAITVDGFLKKWELPSAKLIYTKKINSNNAALSAAGNFLLVKTWTYDKMSAELINASTGKTLFVKTAPASHSAELTEIEISPYGNDLYVMDGGKLIIHSLPSGKIAGNLFMNPLPVQLAFSGNGRYIYYYSENSDSLSLYHLEEKRAYQLDLRGYMEFSPDSRQLISNTHAIRILDPSSGELQHELEGYDKPSMRAHFTGDGKYIFLSRTNQFIRGMEPYDSVTKIWDAASGKLVRTLKMNSGDISSVRMSPDHKYIVTIAGSAVVWDADGNYVNEFDSRQVSFDGASRYAAITGDKEVIIYSLQNRRTISVLKGSSNRLVNASLSRDGKQLATLTNEDHVKIWSLNFGKIDHTIKQQSAIQNAEFTADQSRLLITTADSVKIVDGKNGELVYAADKKITDVRLSPDGKLLILSSGKQVYIKDVATGKDFLVVSEDYEMGNVAISKNANYAWYIFGKSAAGLIDLNTKKIVRFYLGEENIRHCEFSPDEKYFFLQGERATARLYITATGSLYRSFSERSKTEYSVSGLFPEADYLPVSWQGENAVFSEDGKSILFRNYMDRYIVSRRMDDPDHADTIFTKTHLARQSAIIPNSPFLITVTTDDSIRIWQKIKRHYTVMKVVPGNGFKITADGKLTILINDSQLSLLETKSLNIVMKAIGMNETDFFTQPGNEAYYMATKKAVSQLTFRYRGEYFSYEQFDLKFNRPDKVLDGIGYADKKLIDSYRKAYEKRLKKLGLPLSVETVSPSAPKLSLNNRNSLEFEQSHAVVDLVITASGKASLNRFHIRVNEVPLFGAAGLSLKKRSRFDTTISISLTDSLNVIETSVSDVNGAESYRYPLYLNYQPAIPAKEKLWFVGIGVDRFVDSKHNLYYSVKDIRDLALKLKMKYGSQIEIDTLFNEEVNEGAVRQLKTKLLRSSINDKVILAYSGHGLLTKDFDYFLSTYSVDFANPQNGGLPYDALESLLDSIPARKKLMLIDACHSGEVDKEEMQHYRQAMATSGNKGLKGGELENIDPAAKLGMKNSFELMQELFVNVGRSTGATIISAAAATQLAQERGDLKNGVFTFSILEFMEQNPSATITELKNYVNKRVPELTNGLQVPTTRTETKLVDWRVW